jgi:hypothetical protein
MLNSLYTYFYGDYASSNQCLNIQTASCGSLRRQGSTGNNASYVKYMDRHPDYTYGVDSCQTIYLAERIAGVYTVTILFTRNNSPYWIQHTLNLIMIRILLIEKNTPVLQGSLNWAIVGSIDCQPDRDQNQTAFHQDHILTNFVPADVNGVNLRAVLEEFFRFMFPSNPPNVEKFDPMNYPFTNGFKVESPKISHIGILDYLSSIPIIAAAAFDETDSVYTFTMLPASTNIYRLYLYYFNSITTHATPDNTTINADNIRAWYEDYPDHPLNTYYGGFQTLDELMAVIEEYSSLFDKMEKIKRNFRRFLAKVIMLDAEYKAVRIEALKAIFKDNATHIYDFTTTPKTETSKAIPAKHLKDPRGTNTNEYSHAYKTYSFDEIADFRRQLTPEQGTSSATPDLATASEDATPNALPRNFSLPKEIVEYSGHKPVEDASDEEDESDDDEEVSDVEDVIQLPATISGTDPVKNSGIPAINPGKRDTELDVETTGKKVKVGGSRSKTRQKRNRRRNTKKRQNKKGKGKGKRKTLKRKQKRTKKRQ